MTDDLRDEFEIGEAPLLLLPVRLETRFKGDDLKIRIYPDQIHVDDHAPKLTELEQELGVGYWNRRLDGDPDGARDALVAELPPRRAVWVARKTRPAVDGASGPREFPELSVRSGTKPAEAALMPDRWCAAGFVEGRQVFAEFGEPVAEPLHCSPDVAELVPYGEDGLPVDEAMAWMVDYDRALAAGMAITVDVGGIDLGADGLDVVVLGVRDRRGGGDALLGLLEAHHYTDGLEVLAQGTPTNNTDAAASGWTPDVDDVAALFATELDDAGLADPEDSAAAQLVTALALGDDSLLRRVPGAGTDEDTAMGAMNRALWAVTWGRYLDDLMAPETGPSLVPGTAIGALSAFFADHVRGGAPLPALAAGSQPYGLLPVMLRDGGDLHGADTLVALEAVLLELRGRWQESLPAVAVLDPVDRGAAEETVAEVLGLLPHPGRFVVRRLTWQWALRTGTWGALWDLTGEPGSPLAGLAYVRAVTFPGLESVEEELELLRAMHADPSLAGVAPRDHDDARTVLDSFIAMCEAHLGRQTPLNEWYGDDFSGVFEEWVTTDPKLFFSDYGNATADRLFNRPLVAGPDGPDAAAYLAALRPRVANPGADAEPPDFGGDEPLLYQLLDAVVEDVPASQRADYRAALDTLAEEEHAGGLELRLRETLGLASHRLDAWLTGLASRALAEHREGGGSELKIGGYGWVERLVPDAASTRESEGFVHAPSLAHAATAAVLRAGWSAHGSDESDPLLAVDLRSERVRTAAYLLDGVRQGGELGDLLGCRFERRLHDDRLDHLIDQCRRRVLEAEGIERDPRGPVDGLALADLYQGAGVEIEPGGVVRAGTEETDPERARLQAALEDIRASMDAVDDAAIADSVHHFLQGNSERASASLESVATGAVPPPELRSLDTPRPGASVSHRVLVTLGGGHASGWGESPRAALEPALEHWAASVLGDPARVRLTVVVPAAGREIGITLADLAVGQGMGALDAVFETEAGWADRARAQVLADPENAAYEDGLEVDTLPEVAAPDVAAGDFAELTASLRGLLGSARPLDARDLAMPGTDAESGVDPAGAEARVEAFRSGLAAAADTVDALLADPAAPLDALRAALHGLAAHGVPGALPLHGYAEETRAALEADAATAAAAARARLDEAAALDGAAVLGEAAPPPDPPSGSETPAPRARRARERAAALAGRGFPLLPDFAADSAELESALAQSGALLGGDPARAVGWLRSVARVREETGRLEDVVTAAELIDDEARIEPVVGQLPADASDAWIALAAGRDPRQGALSLFVVDGGGRARLRDEGRGAGLVVDAWAETIPAGEVVTGVALNYDAPTSRPPQALLLALPPEGRRWSFDRVLNTLLDTRDAAKLRAVDPDILSAYGHQAPAVFPPGSISAGPQEEPA